MDDHPGLIMTIVVLVVAMLLFLGMWGCPRYNVWQQGLQGQAELERAKQNRQIEIARAEAARDAAKSLAEAEIERARGVAEANKIIGESLRGNEAYLRYLWIDGLQKGETPQVVYIPTEAGLPILEAGRSVKR